MVTSIRLAPETERRLDSLAARTGRTKAFYLRELIERGLADLEDYYLAADVPERVPKGHGKVYSTAEVRTALGLDDELSVRAVSRGRRGRRRMAPSPP